MKKINVLFFGINSSDKSRDLTILNRSYGSHRLATFLRENNVAVEVIDYTLFWKIEELKELFKSRYSSELVFVGFSILFNLWSEKATEFVRWIKKEYPDLPIVVGGNSVLMMQDIPEVDLWIDGYGEYAVLELIRSLKNQRTNDLHFDTNLDRSGKIIRAMKTYPAYPMLDYSVKFDKNDFILPYEWGAMELSRGCRFQCAYCGFPILGVKKDHTASAESFKENLIYNYDNFGIKNYTIFDETFNDGVDKIKKYADVVEKLDFDVFFSGYIRLDLMITRTESREQLARMNLAGHYYGVESLNYDTLKAIGKGMHPDKIKQGLIDIRDYFNKNSKFYRAHANFIAGLPHETVESLNATVSWLSDNYLDQSFHMHPLVVIKKELLEQETNSSKISKNPELYKIELLDSTVRRNSEPVTKEFLDKNIITNSPNFTNWKNPQMTAKIASDISRSLNPRNRKLAPVYNLEIPYFLNKSNSLTPEYLKNFNKSDIPHDFRDTVVADFINGYIKKKLSF